MALARSQVCVRCDMQQKAAWREARRSTWSPASREFQFLFGRRVVWRRCALDPSAKTSFAKSLGEASAVILVPTQAKLVAAVVVIVVVVVVRCRCSRHQSFIIRLGSISPSSRPFHRASKHLSPTRPSPGRHAQIIAKSLPPPFRLFADLSSKRTDNPINPPASVRWALLSKCNRTSSLEANITQSTNEHPSDLPATLVIRPTTPRHWGISEMPILFRSSVCNGASCRVAFYRSRLGAEEDVQQKAGFRSAPSHLSYNFSVALPFLSRSSLFRLEVCRDPLA